MENASQALIIAGAILLAILIVALGITVFNGARDKITGGANRLNQEQIAANNQRIENYTNRTIKGSELKDLLSKISIAVSTSDAPAANSITIKPKDENKPNTLDNNFQKIDKLTDDKQKEDYLNKVNNLVNNIRTNAHYKVVPTDKDPKSGLIIGITVENGDN